MSQKNGPATKKEHYWIVRTKDKREELLCFSCVKLTVNTEKKRKRLDVPPNERGARRGPAPPHERTVGFSPPLVLFFFFFFLFSRALSSFHSAGWSVLHALFHFFLFQTFSMCVFWSCRRDGGHIVSDIIRPHRVILFYSAG